MYIESSKSTLALALYTDLPFTKFQIFIPKKTFSARMKKVTQ
jgi:hypothetical protein